jgi:hypothetical protein
VLRRAQPLITVLACWGFAPAGCGNTALSIDAGARDAVGQSDADVPDVGSPDTSVDRAESEVGEPPPIYCSASPACLCPTGPELVVCCFAGFCGWEGSVTESCVQSVRFGSDCPSVGLPPSYPDGVLCPDNPGGPCEHGADCPGTLPRTGDPCSATGELCHYCWPGGQRGASRSVECSGQQWLNLGASACNNFVEPP